MTAVEVMQGVDTVAVAVPDHVGRLIGKRVSRAMWESIAESGMAMPDFHLATGLENEPVEGLEATGAQTGFRNGVLRPDLATLRRLPWNDGTAMVICDAYRPDGTAAEVAPRWMLRRQIERLDSLGLQSSMASELEFYLFRTSYAVGHRSGFRRLRPAYHRHGDNDLLVDGHIEQLLGEIRRFLPQAGVPVELSQGEGGIGQYEVTLRHAAPLEMADRHVVYKHGVKQLAGQHALAATFMAKVRDDQPGSSCHVHISLRAADGPVFADESGELTAFGRSFLAGLLAYAPELCLVHAPFVNSYRRLQPESWAPANLTWGFDNRTTLIRVCGTGAERRLEFRLPGADANPYLTFAAVIAAGLEGVERGLDPPPASDGNAYRASATVLPRDLSEAVALFAGSEFAARAFGPDVHTHLLRLAEHERDLGRRLVTDVELMRGFEVA